MLCATLSLLMNVTCVPRATLTFFGLTVLLLIVIVCVATASDGAVVGLLGLAADELDELPQALIASAAAAAMTAATNIWRCFMPLLDLKTRRPLHQYGYPGVAVPGSFVVATLMLPNIVVGCSVQ